MEFIVQFNKFKAWQLQRKAPTKRSRTQQEGGSCIGKKRKREIEIEKTGQITLNIAVAFPCKK